MSEAAQEVRPLLLLGESRRAALVDALTRCATAWRDLWSTTRDRVQVVLLDDHEHTVNRSAGASGTSMAAFIGTSTIAMQLRASHEALAAALGVTGVGGNMLTSDGSRGIAGELQTEVLRSLCSEILMAARIDNAKIEAKAIAQPSGRSAHSGFANAAISFGNSRGRMAVLLSAELVEALVPRKLAPQMDDISRLRQAITDEPVQVEAVLGQVEISLNDLARLSVDDVIVLEQSLASTGYLAMPDGRRIGNILLGSAGGQRAVSVTK